MPPASLRLRPAFASTNVPAIPLAPGEAKTIGRSPQADIVINEPSLSRIHARLTMAQDGRATVEDLASTNGVRVNNVRQPVSMLTVGDRLQFGLVEYCVEAIHAPRQRSIEQSMVRRSSDTDLSHSVDAGVLASLLATSRELIAFGDLRGLLDRVLDRLQPLLMPDRSAILLFDSATGELTPRVVRPPGAYASVSEFASSTMVREAISARDVIEAHDASLDARLQDAASVARSGIRSALCVPLLGRTGPIGALYVDRLVFASQFTPMQVQIALAFAAHAATALETARLYEDRERHFHATLEAFAKAIDARDHYTAGHSERVTAYALTLARASGVADADLETIRRASMLHDIGKVGVPDRVLLKPGPFTPDERALMEAHVTIGCDMLGVLPLLVDVLPIIRGHHERWDGDGYPDRLGGDDIPPYSRILTVADSYDAMTTARPYRGALSDDEAASRLRAGRGTQFEPRAVDVFDEATDEIRDIRRRTAGLSS